MRRKSSIVAGIINPVVRTQIPHTAFLFPSSSPTASRRSFLLTKGLSIALPTMSGNPLEGLTSATMLLTPFWSYIPAQPPAAWMSHHHTPANILTVNPYESHPSLSPFEAATLWEYAKLAYNVRMVRPLLYLLLERQIAYIPPGAHRSRRRRASSTRSRIR